MNTIVLCILLSSLSVSLNTESILSTIFIGLEESEIKELLLENHKAFKLNNTVVNNKYNYLKYEDSIREVTVLFFLSQENRCTMVRLMSDYSNLNDYLKELKSNFEEVSDNLWELKSADKTYRIELEEGDWFFTISIKEKE